jgi:hypothetical protein
VKSRGRAAVALIATLLGTLVALLAPSTAGAANRIYWTDQDGDKVSSAKLDGSGDGQNLDTTGAVAPSNPSGVAIDAARGRIYWADGNPDPDGEISFANLSGGGGGGLNTGSATVDNPWGLAIDPAGGRIYWANHVGFPDGAISYANLDGSGGGDVDTSGSASLVHNPAGVAIDPAANRIYWANFGDNHISYANLNDTGGSDDLDLTDASPPSGPSGLAIDKAAGRIYWTNFFGSLISSAKLAPGGDGDDLDTTAAPPVAAFGAAIDPAAGRIYWPNLGPDTLAFADLDDQGGGGTLGTMGVTPSNPVWPAILKSPVAASAPQVGGGSEVGDTLSCTQGTWAPDLVGAHLSRAPRSFARQWTRNGTNIAGATSATFTANQPGAYRCKVTATNFAGPSSQTSAAKQVSEPQPPSPPSNEFTIGKAKNNKKKGTAKLPVTIPGGGEIGLSGAKVKPASVTAEASGEFTLPVKPKGKAKKKLKKKGKARVAVDVTFTPTGGDPNTQSDSLKLKKR